MERATVPPSQLVRIGKIPKWPKTTVYAGNRNIRQVPGEAEMQRDFFETRTKVLSGQKTFSNKTVTTRREILPGSSESGGRGLDGPLRRF